MNPSAYYRKYNKKLKNSSLRAKKLNCLFEESRLMTTNASPKTRLTLKKLMLRSGFAEQFVEADVLLFIEAERVFIAQRSGLLSGLVCQFSVGIHNIGSKGVRLGRTPGLAERGPLSDKR